jgi:uncharacterized protein
MKILSRVAAFYGLTFVFTILLAIVQQAAGLDAETIILPQFGPGVAAVVMIAWFRSDNPRISIAPKQVSFSKYLVAFGLPMLVTTLLFLIYSQFVQRLTIAFPTAASLALMLGGMLLGAFGEELGWRSYLQNLLDKRLNGLAAFLLVGILWVYGMWAITKTASCICSFLRWPQSAIRRRWPGCSGTTTTMWSWPACSISP